MPHPPGALAPERYSRQLRLEGFGPAGQERLRQASVLVSRVGGVGGTVAALLAQAGVGRLLLAHGGRIEPEHLNRMPLANAADVGRECAAVFAEKITALNPDVEVVPVASNVTAENVTSLVDEVDLITDAAPLFEERYLMNREAVRQRKPLVMAAMYGTDVCVTTVIPHRSPCLACLFPERPPDWNHVGVFPAIGPSPRLAGSIAAMEGVKLLTGYGQDLAGTLLFYDLAHNHFRSFQVTRRSDCQVCSVHPVAVSASAQSNGSTRGVRT